MLSSRVVSVDDLRARARRRLPALAYDYVVGGAQDELSVAANTQALQELRLRQRVFVDVGDIDTSTTLLGRPVRLPLFVSPMGLLSMFHPDNDQGVARAAAAAGATFVHSAWSGVHLDEVVEAAPGAVWEQVAFWKNPALTDHQLQLATDAGIETIVLPGDVAVSAKRERDLHHGLADLPPRYLSPADLLSCALRPGWAYRFLTGPRMTFGNFTVGGRPIPMSQMRAFMHDEQQPAVSWADVERLRKLWPGTIVVKGVMCAQDAKLAAAHGVDAVIVSNHGGRQFDNQPGTPSVLPEIAAAAGDQLEVYVDGGVTRGDDVVKLLASGARAVGVGRAAVWGLAAAGQAGVAKAFELMAEELAIAMGFVGRTRIADLDADVLVG